jgi:hypothetical protein
MDGTRMVGMPREEYDSYRDERCEGGGTGTVLERYRDGTGMVQGWYRDGTGTVQGWYREGTGMVQGR